VCHVVAVHGDRQLFEMSDEFGVMACALYFSDDVDTGTYNECADCHSRPE
jgi:hypothetical protein